MSLTVNRYVGAITIGQSPRPDLLAPLRARIPDDVEIVEAGALDRLTAGDLPARPGAQPLTTRLRDGSPVTVDESFLEPLVQAALDDLEARGAEVTLLLCAADFMLVEARGRLVRPFVAASEELRALGARRIVVVVPIAGQTRMAERKWWSSGFDVMALVGDPGSISTMVSREAFVLDFVGHPASVVEALRARASVPVIDLGEAGADAAAAYFR